MQILAIILQVLLGLAFLGAGGQKLAASEEMVNDFERFGYPRWFLYATGAVEITGAIGMLAGIFVPLVGALAGMWLAAVMLGALFTHLRTKDSASKMVPALVLLVLVLAVSTIHFFG